MRTTISFAVLAIALTGFSTLKAELAELYVENTSPITANFVGGSNDFDFLHLPNGGIPAVATFSVSYSSLGDLQGLSGSYSGQFTIGAVSYYGGAQIAQLTPAASAFSVGDGSGSFLTGSIEAGELFRNPRLLEVRLSIADLHYNGANAGLAALSGASELDFRIPVYFAGNPPTIDALKQTNSSSLGTVYDGFITGCVSPIPETPWYALALGLTVAAWTKRSLFLRKATQA